MRIIRARAFGEPTENFVFNLARNISTMGPVRRLLELLTDRLFLAPTLPGAELCVVERRESVLSFLGKQLPLPVEPRRHMRRRGERQNGRGNKQNHRAQDERTPSE
jgi:hypothetical protein